MPRQAPPAPPMPALPADHAGLALPVTRRRTLSALEEPRLAPKAPKMLRLAPPAPPMQRLAPPAPPIRSKTPKAPMRPDDKRRQLNRNVLAGAFSDGVIQRPRSAPPATMRSDDKRRTLNRRTLALATRRTGLQGNRTLHYIPRKFCQRDLP